MTIQEAKARLVAWANNQVGYREGDNNANIYCGWYGADGEYGQQAKIALYQFQQKNGLETDNICGQATWKSLLDIG